MFGLFGGIKQRIMAESWHLFSFLIIYALHSFLCYALPAPQGFSGLIPRTVKVSEPTERALASSPQSWQPEPAVESSQSCEVNINDKVQCGKPNISAADCESINCCFDGQQCYYRKAVTVQCIKDGQFVVVVARDATLPRLSLDSIHLLGADEASCSPVGTTAAYVIYQFPVTACGTRMAEGGGYLIYENAMVSSYEVGIGHFGAITRDSHFELLFQCRYSATSVEALAVQVSTVPPPLPIAVPGPLNVELRLGNGKCTAKGCVEGDVAYTSYYTEADYPVTKVLREPVYVEVRVLGRTDPNIIFTLGHCWATSTPDLLGLPQWDLLVNGCPYQDDRYLTTMVPVDESSGLQFPTHYKRFIVKMFTFVDPESLFPLTEKVFIHCSTAVCHPTAAEPCVQRCNRQRRAVPERTSPEKVVSSGELIIISV